MEKEVANPNEHLIRRKRKIAEEHRRGNDTRTDAERKEAGRKKRQPRKYALCSLCDENLARRGWAKNYCIKCAKKKGYSPQKKINNRSHHKKEKKIQILFESKPPDDYPPTIGGSILVRSLAVGRAVAGG